jgi:hypothetical protein
MSRADKLRAMEILWADLSQDEAKVDFPDWHGTALREAEELVRAGRPSFQTCAWRWAGFGEKPPEGNEIVSAWHWNEHRAIRENSATPSG